MKKSIIILIIAIAIMALIGCFCLGRNSSRIESESASTAQPTEPMESAEVEAEASTEPDMTETITEIPEVSAIPEVTESGYTQIQEVSGSEAPAVSEDSGVDENEIDYPITLS